MKRQNKFRALGAFPELFLLAFDPGAMSGWALFKNGRLVACGYKKKEKLLAAVMEALERFDVRPGQLRVALEIPRDYPSEKRQVDPNVLIRTAITGSHYVGFCEALFDSTCDELHAQNWKGNIPKPKTGEKYLIEDRVIAKLDKEERELVYQTKSSRAKSLNFDMLDAVGVGLHRVGRRIK